MLFGKRLTPLLAISLIALVGCQTAKPHQLLARETKPELKLWATAQAPYIYSVNKEVRGPVADIVRQACRQIKLDCVLTMDDGGTIRDGYKAIESSIVDGILAVEKDASMTERLDYTEPLFMQGGQDHLYYLAISKKFDAQLAQRFNQSLRQLLQHEDAGNIYARYALRPQVLFPCTYPLRNIAAELSKDDVERMRVEAARVFYSAEEFAAMSCSYEQRFVPYGGGIVKDAVLGVLWQYWLRPHLMTWNEIPGYLQKLNQEHFGGCSQWRLPTTEELYSISAYGPGNHTLPIFWSADQERLSDHIWTVDLKGGEISPAGRGETLAVIAVCSAVIGE